MSFPWMPPIYNVKGRTTQWINSCVSTHDCFCGCDKPLYHLIYELQKQGGFHQIGVEEENLIKKCLGTRTVATTDASTTTAPEEPELEGDINIGDLELLFAENGDDKDDTR